MKSTEARAATLPGYREDAPAVVRASFKRLIDLLLSLVRLRARDEEDIVARYAGCGWNDGVERQIVDDVASLRRTRL